MVVFVSTDPSWHLGSSRPRTPGIEARRGVRPRRRGIATHRRPCGSDGGRRAEAFAERHGVERVLETYADVVADPEVEAVYNPLANGLHAPWNLAAIAAEGLPGVEMTYRIVGTRGEATVANFVLPQLDDRLLVTTAAGDRVEHLGKRSSYTYQLEAFTAYVREGVPMTTDSDDAVATMKLIDQCYRAIGLERRPRFPRVSPDSREQGARSDRTR